MADIFRYDIVQHAGGWLLSDSRSPPRPYVSSTEALSVAVAESRARPEPTEVYLWRQDEPELVYRTEGALAKPAGAEP